MVNGWYVNKNGNHQKSCMSVHFLTGNNRNTRCMWAGGTYANYPDFCKNHQFHVIYCVTLAYVLYFKEFLTLDSRRFVIFKEWLTESVGLVPFSAKYLIYRHVRTDWRMDWQTDWRTDEYTCCAWAGGTWFPVVLLCKFFGFWREIGFGVTHLRT